MAGKANYCNFENLRDIFDVLGARVSTACLVVRGNLSLRTAVTAPEWFALPGVDPVLQPLVRSKTRIHATSWDREHCILSYVVVAKLSLVGRHQRTYHVSELQLSLDLDRCSVL